MIKEYSYKELFVSILLGLGVFLIGFDSKVFPVVFYSLREVYGGTPEKFQLVKSLYLIGEIIGVIICGKLIDKLGRKAVVNFSFVLLLISFIGLAFISLLPELIFLFRPLQGIGLGLLLVATPIFLLETIKQHARGKYLMILYSFGAIGVLTGFLVSYLFERYSLIALHNMYLIYLLQFTFTLLYFLFYKKIPANNYFVSTDITNKVSLKLLFSRELVPVLILLLASSVLYSFSNNFVIHYLTIESLNKGGIGNLLNYRLEIIFAVISFIGILTAAFFGDKIGRKKSLIAGIFGLIIVSLFEIIQFMFIQNEGINILMNGFFCFLFAFSLASTLYLTILELLPLRIRGRGFSFFHILIMFFSGVSLFLYQRLNYGGKNDNMEMIFAIVLIICLFGVVLFKRTLPETKDKKLNE